MARRTLFLGVDDTDMPGTMGTGRLARMLLERLAESGLQPVGVTRHQLLVHPDIPYTSHNSSACLELVSVSDDEDVHDGSDVTVAADAAIRKIAETAEEYLLKHAAKGSDVGLCLEWAENVPGEVVEFGRSAQERVLRIADARDLASRHGIFLKPLTGTGGGVIGALSAVGLRSYGTDGRYLHLGGIRELIGVVTVADALAAGIAAVVDADGNNVPADVRINTLDWVRPALVGGRPVLKLTKSEGDDNDMEPDGARESFNRRRQKQSVGGKS
ncbi:MAG TPA: ABC transporter substrate-binding protein [Candidatus Brocadiia bacterium]|nr:ABC transporter substrate-binding protein [Candidatus Brocadiia bacterium]